MCGIIGFAGFMDRVLLKNMADVIRHRGPDDHGYFFDKNISLGARRLSIIDIKGSKQPIYNENKDIVLVFNGEIYNFQKLREELHQLGHNFSTDGDGEVIVHLYEQYGEECVTKLNGMFAFAIWDARKKKLFIARDRLGIKPLYYTQIGNRFLFGSEIKSILQYRGYKPDTDRNALSDYLTFRYVPGPLTMFKNIFKLLPCHTLTYQDGKVETKKYWYFAFNSTNKSEDFYVKTLKNLLEDSIKSRLISEVPLGAYLSGGLDSSFVVGLMSKISQEPINTFTVTFDDIEFNEAPYAKSIAEHFNTNHRSLEVKQKSINILPKVIYHMDEPVSDPATIPTYMMAELTKKHVTVVLTGEGSDELFGGYPQYRAAMIDKKLGPFRKIIPKLTKNDLMKRFDQDYTDWISIFTEKEKQELLKEKPEKNNTVIQRPYDLNQLLYFDIKQWLPDDLLTKVDKTTMAHSVEARVPFLDHRMVEFAGTVPPKYKTGMRQEKIIIRKAMQGIVPKETINRKKQGFHVPIEKWFQGELKEVAQNMLSESVIEKRGYFQYPYVKSLLNKFDSSPKYYSRQLWNLFNLELWHRIFIDQEKQKKI
ncbi:MAG: asparagine synthase (glutamine-hydrolyzing) [Nanoarchaeota archaeon]|nr:asparagine synthase (glutamine-hydrolyzing) [Nanoarchaeota archaeon]MBU2520564.1 asparagine synthase (glutamine-hydrolyzing) [Nanoarchaeota archaeon]